MLESLRVLNNNTNLINENFTKILDNATNLDVEQRSLIMFQTFMMQTFRVLIIENFTKILENATNLDIETIAEILENATYHDVEDFIMFQTFLMKILLRSLTTT